jgi:adenylosuccinate synthase
MTEAYAIIGMQYGSEAKGALAGYLAKEWGPDLAIANWSPNAGHTYDDKIVRRCIPLGSLSHNCHTVLLGPGSIIDPDIFQEEYDTLGGNVEVIVHPNAAIVTDLHRNIENDPNKGDFEKIGSTRKGAGAAAIERAMRHVKFPNVASFRKSVLPDAVISEEAYHNAISSAQLVQIEGCQGHSLSLYNGFYPYTTSRDTSIHQLKADVAWHEQIPVEVYGCMRTYPIRVAGTSGPHYTDQEETSWNRIGVNPEITTVTRRVRRVFTFSRQQIIDAAMINFPKWTYLSGCDYVDEDLCDEIINTIDIVTGNRPRWKSSGPLHADMQDNPYV